MSERLLICGGREFKDEEAAFEFLDSIAAGHDISLVIEGGARGGDAIGRAWAEARGIEVVTYHADWSVGRKAGPIRNQLMLDDGKPTLVAALPGGKGTAHMVSIAREAGVEVVEMV
jgi:hypothetical protein